MASEMISYNQADIRVITKGFKAMDDEAIKQAKANSGGLAEYLKGKIISAAGSVKNKAALRVAQGSVVSKSSKIGEISFGYARQKFSGSGTTQINQGIPKGGPGILGGLEFGSNIYKQFPVWSGPGKNGGSKGWFIYPTLTAEQPYLIAQWEKGLDQIVKEFK